MTATTRKLLDTRETASVLGCSVASVHRYVKDGLLVPVVLRERGKTRFRPLL